MFSWFVSRNLILAARPEEQTRQLPALVATSAADSAQSEAVSHSGPSGPASSRALDRILGIDALLTFALLGGIAFLRLRIPIGDPDLGWHLAAGRHILDHLALPGVDRFSYVAEGRPWVVYSWLAEALLAACDRAFGPGGLIATAALLLASTFAIVLSTCRATGARHSVAVAVTFFAAAVSAPTWTVRPHLFSFLFMAIFCHVLITDRRHDGDDACERPTRHLWRLAPITVLWANTHVFFIFGLAALGLDVVTRWRQWLWTPARPRVAWSRCAVLVAVSLATFANPYGWRLWEHLSALAADDVTFAMVTELQTPSLHAIHGQLLTAFFFATVLTLTLSRTHKEPTDLAAVFLFAFLAYSMARNMPFFAIVAAPVFARHAEALLPTHAAPRTPLSPTRRAFHAVLLGTCSILFALGLRGAPVSSADAAISRSRYPVDAVTFMNAQPVLGRLFNHFNWGGYLIAQLYPRYQVSMDGRTGVYGNDTLREYRATQYLQREWRTFLERCDPDVILWKKDEPFVRGLELLPAWRRLYEDDLAVIFVRQPSTERHESAASGTQAAATKHCQG